MTDTISSTEGTIPFTVEGETYQTWYKLFGNIDESSHRPLVVLHGGPGLTHDYLIPLSDLAASSIPVILYDQIGNGHSTHLREKPHSFITFDLFIDELINLLHHFGIHDDFDVLGHSWGGMLAVEFTLRRRLPGMKHLILSNTTPAMHLVRESNSMLQKDFPQDEKDAWLKGPTSENFLKAAVHFFSLHGCLLQPPPEEMGYSLAQGGLPDGDTTVNTAMAAGDLKDWDANDRLQHIDVPTLVLNGRADYMQDFVCVPFFQHIPRVKWITFERSSHMPFWEERERYMQVVEGFLSL